MWNHLAARAEYFVPRPSWWNPLRRRAWKKAEAAEYSDAVKVANSRRSTG